MMGCTRVEALGMGLSDQLGDILTLNVQECQGAEGRGWGV